MRILIAEDWWADRIRFELLLNSPNVEIQFAWDATLGGRGAVWPPERIAREARAYDRVLLDLAWNIDEEVSAREMLELETAALQAEASSVEKRLGGLRTLAVAASSAHGIEALDTSKWVIVTAYKSDPIRTFCWKRWGVSGVFHKWTDDRVLYTLLVRDPLRAHVK
jgi:hypothetical protein